MADTNIEWATKVWNPVTGCTKVSEGCRNCYAERMTKRLVTIPGSGYSNFEVTLRPERLEQPLKWKKPQRIFVNSMSDLFHDDIPDEFIADTFEIMGLAEQHTFIVLTKRPQRMYELLWTWYEGEKGYFPPSNIWLGVSVENQETADERIPLLLQTPAAVSFVSCEPLLGPIDLYSDSLGDLLCKCEGCMSMAKKYPENPGLQRIDWVIVGGETGPGARPMHPEWARSLKNQCQEAGVPFFFKQWGEWEYCGEQMPFFGARYSDGVCIDGYMWDLDSCEEPHGLLTHGGEEACPICKGCGFIRVGKKRAGNQLDGRVWNEFPR